MTCLVDTHIFLWYLLNDPRLGKQSRELIDDFQNTILVSPIVYWEIALKVGKGKLKLNTDYLHFIEHGMQTYLFRELPIQAGYTAALLSLPFHHRDPFDRLLIAQGVSEGLPIISEDTKFDHYPITRIF
jgi:PIN domain nuclease of toxin-antitoxin system